MKDIETVNPIDFFLLECMKFISISLKKQNLENKTKILPKTTCILCFSAFLIGCYRLVILVFGEFRFLACFLNNYIFPVFHYNLNLFLWLKKLNYCSRRIFWKHFQFKSSSYWIYFKFFLKNLKRLISKYHLNENF